MKKLFSLLAVAALFAACNNEAETGMSAEDSARIADSTRQAWIKDSTEAAMKMDTTKHMMDTTMNADTTKK